MAQQAQSTVLMSARTKGSGESNEGCMGMVPDILLRLRNEAFARFPGMFGQSRQQFFKLATPGKVRLAVSDSGRIPQHPAETGKVPQGTHTPPRH